ncbi:hypothetical protein BP5796_01684 [Coleophoma crateriformis]|uniref:DNA (cytosine-5-)-methyltransferase n=1 Tax=Coleophoma crateriformis TaxID=565419 RepID=A0A3D8T190_9HELO|nr:hypothetical protein BP5796_01684 [Coleophoma crateriformis]
MEVAKSRQSEAIIIEDSDDDLAIVSKGMRKKRRKKKSITDYRIAFSSSAAVDSTSIFTARSVTDCHECTPVKTPAGATATAISTPATFPKHHISTPNSASTSTQSKLQTPLTAKPQTPATTPQELAKSIWTFPSQDSSPTVRKGKEKAVDLISDSEDDDEQLIGCNTSRMSCYSISDDEIEISNDTPVTTVKRRSHEKQPADSSSSRDREVIDIECIDLEAFEDEDFASKQNRPVLRVDDVYAEEPHHRPSQRRSTALPPRNPPIRHPYERIEQVIYNGMNLRPGKVVELCNEGVHQEEDFLRISSIVRHITTREVTLRGAVLQRNRHLNGLLERKLNEVCERYEIDLDDPRKPEEQCVVEVQLSQVVRIRKTVTTNLLFPHGRDIEVYENAPAARLNGTLMVRWKYICKYDTASHRQKNVWRERIVMRCTETEVPNNVISDAELRRSWLDRFNNMTCNNEEASQGSIFVHVDPDEGAPAVRKGSSSSARSASVRVVKVGRKREQSPDVENGSKKRKAVIDLEDTNRIMSRLSVEPVERNSVICLDLGSAGHIPPTGTLQCSSQTPKMKRPRGNIWTYGDAFCGAGGASRGADLAGLEIKWGFDHWEHACSTWIANFPSAHCYQMHCHQFVSEVNSGRVTRVDMLHISPPCQTWSPAHTVAGKNDEMNTASLFAVMAIIMAVRPRIVTLEQTFGICMARFQQYFNALIQQFTSINFSVRWAIIPLQNLGLPQRRHRLIIIAACPGEILPRMPAFTHSDGSDGLQPFLTVNEVLAKINGRLRQEPRDPILDTANPCDPPKSPYDGSKFLRRAITTHGGQNYRPDGFSDFTLREYAGLQGFPPYHVFKGLGIKKQIGNAVPPTSAEALFRSIIQDLGGTNEAASTRPIVID